MSKKFNKITAFLAGAAIITSLGMQVLIPRHVDAAVQPICFRPAASADGQVPTGKILFKTNQYQNWNFYKTQYPEDMFFATIVNQEGQLTHNKGIPKDILHKFTGPEYTNQLILFASMGASSAQSDIGIEKVTVSGKNMTVYVHTKSPHPDQFITMNIIYPDDYITIDRSLIEVRGTMKVTFVDQNGKIVGKSKLKIKR